jgi:hypothetical protein
VLAFLLQLSLAPLLLGACSYTAMRWGEHAAALLSGVPAVVGPLLLALGSEHGARFAAATAAGIVTGLVSLGGFCGVYALLAVRCRWQLSLLGGWAAAGVLSAAMLALAPGRASGLLAAAAALLAARAATPAARRAEERRPEERGGSALTNMVLGGVLVALLAALASTLGPHVGGALAGLPVVVSVLAVSAHRRRGTGGALRLLAGVPLGMVGFVAFCEAVALLAVPAGLALSLALASATALAAQALSLTLARRSGVLRGLVRA